MGGLVIGFKQEKEMVNSITEDTVQIRDVWNDNLEDEFAKIRGILGDYNYVAMDTEFPGHIHKRPRNDRFGSKNTEECYNFLKSNVNPTKLIQLGLTFFNENGDLPTCGTDKYCVWQFNFREFDRDKDQQAPNSIQLLADNGIDFEKFKEKGVDIRKFGDLLMSSGVVMKDCLGDVHWIVFHGEHDFGYVLKVLKDKDLEGTKETFFELVRTYFPIFYDVKHICYTNGRHGGLNRVAEILQVQRIGVSHQAGSDSLLTCRVFMKLKEISPPGSIESSVGILHDLQAVK